MENELNNKQKFWLSFMAILMVGLSLISVFIMVAWINTPTTFTTHHYFNGDEYVEGSLESLVDITREVTNFESSKKDISYGEKINCTSQMSYWNGSAYEPSGQYQPSTDCYALRNLEVLE